MALSKRVALGNGIATNYHRVVTLNIVTNAQNLIEVASYTSRAKRAEEKSALAAGEPMDVYVGTAIHAAPYDQEMTVEGAYAWLKANAPEFEGAADVLEEGGGAVA